ncbi:fasciclin domain-containing protein [Tamaricihabitans halophyticus]|nr:fasciclin domain-containing protein [Tamaricihabitans halophyticus]
MAGTIGLLAVVLAGCGTSDDQAGENTAEQEAAATEQTQSSPAASNGETTADDVFGPGCDQVPTDPNDQGSVEGMIDDPVGTAASNNPLLTTLTDAVTQAGLVDTLNDTEAKYTVFAPADPAFDAVPEQDLQALLDDKEQLTATLTYHVVPERMDAQGIVDAGMLETVEGKKITVEGSADKPTVNGANVLCGNIPTANATVFVVDEVLMPPQG